MLLLQKLLLKLRLFPKEFDKESSLTEIGIKNTQEAVYNIANALNYDHNLVTHGINQ
jgi:alpha-L-fucosidase